jgi:ribonuclease HI
MEDKTLGGGYGVYFGSNSEYNVSNLLKPDTPQTSQRAELMACLVALNQIERVAQDVTFTPPLKGVLITTDSAYLVNSMTKYIYKWRENGYTAATESPVVNRDLFYKIDRKLDAMEFGRRQIPVLFWKVDRSDNEDADELAKDAVYS